MLATAGHVAVNGVYAAPTPASNATAPAATAAVPGATMHREQAGPLSFRVGDSWKRLSEQEESLARLQFVANLQEVLDAAPDVPPGSFDQVASFHAYAIPEVGAYLIASVVRVVPYPVQLFDVLHTHARGRNDWGESLYLHVDEVLRSDRYELFNQPALAVDVNMSGQYHLASLFLRIPASDQRIGGLVFLVPSAAWQSFAPTIETVRASLRLGPGDPDEGAVQAQVQDEWIVDEAAEGSAPQPTAAGEPAWQEAPKWDPPKPDENERMGVTLIGARIFVIAISYAVTFFITLRVIYFGLITIGRFVLSAESIESYRKGAEESPWTMGLLRSEGMIMLCAILSMAFAALFLGFVVRI